MQMNPALVVLLIAFISGMHSSLAQNLAPAKALTWIEELHAMNKPIEADEIKQRISELSRRHPSDVIHVTYYRDRPHERLVLFGHPGTGTDGNAIRMSLFYFTQLQNIDLEIGEGIATSVGAVLRLRDGRHLLTNTLYGSNPLVLSSGMQIVYVTYALGHAHVFAVTNTNLSLELGMQADSAVIGRFGNDVTLSIRRDSWFLDVPGYPAMNPFIEQGQPPDPKAYLLSEMLFCHTSSATAGRICKLQQLKPVRQ